MWNDTWSTVRVCVCKATNCSIAGEECKAWCGLHEEFATSLRVCNLQSGKYSALCVDDQASHPDHNWLFLCLCIPYHSPNFIVYLKEKTADVVEESKHACARSWTKGKGANSKQTRMLMRRCTGCPQSTLAKTDQATSTTAYNTASILLSSGGSLRIQEVVAMIYSVAHEGFQKKGERRGMSGSRLA